MKEKEKERHTPGSRERQKERKKERKKQRGPERLTQNFHLIIRFLV